ncbi:hypothetical protein BDP55DRAFT_635493 [Colletotrichum godetiae]|uniref:Rhodopsin domain-containing protein n=1 Tax=Colletotrichum godetiae TaxID=1209918 RepID=A0AAJ0AEP0_9PEZI|nr:uncharacterized protein BDP55DRAFT_635493 [Colletotrichum godetiae]KAK1671864.1 hypothetical protein BDP55DRAFT_635493 [Colletotrichum godetiae]
MTYLADRAGRRTVDLKAAVKLPKYLSCRFLEIHITSEAVILNRIPSCHCKKRLESLLVRLVPSFPPSDANCIHEATISDTIMAAVVSFLLNQHDYAVQARRVPPPYPPMTLDGRNLVIVSCIMMSLTTVWTIMRIMSKYIVGAAYLAEDYFYLVGQVSFVVDFSLYLLGRGWLISGSSRPSSMVLRSPAFSTKPSDGGSKLLFSLVPIFDILIDVIIVALSMKVVSTLQTSRPDKIALYLIFGAGIIFHVNTLWRLYPEDKDTDATAEHNTILFSGVRLYHTLTVDYGNIFMVAFSPILRPIFDRTIARWLNLSIWGNGRTIATGHVRTLRGPATTRNFSGVRTTLSRSDGFKRSTDNSDADDSLSWELEGFETLRRKSDQAQISAHAEAQVPDRISPLSLGGGISVKHTFTIESHVTRLPSFSGFVTTDNQPSKTDVA